MRHDVRAYLADIVDGCALIEQFVEGKSLARYVQDDMLRSAVERQLTIIGEALRQATTRTPEVADRITDAQEIIAFRNRLIHGYMAVEDATVWTVIERDLPLLRRQASQLLNELEAADPTTEPEA
jgi:uncharacterized protein with HEPN domain